jgi:uncharacterized protein (TIGR00369 family)
MPTDPLRARIAESFARQKIMATLGARLTHVAPGAVTIEMLFAEHLTQQHGFLHAGAVATLADSACGYAALTMMPEGSAIVSIEFKVNLLSPSVGERFVAQGRLIRGGKTISVVSGDVHAFDASGAAKHVATMTGTMMRVEPRGGQTG